MISLELQAEALRSATQELLQLVGKLGEQALKLSLVEGGRTVEGHLKNAVVVNRQWDKIFQEFEVKELSEDEIQEALGSQERTQDLVESLRRSSEALRDRMLALSPSDLSREISIPWLDQGEPKELRHFLGRASHNLSFTLGAVASCGEVSGVLEKTPPL